MSVVALTQIDTANLFQDSWDVSGFLGPHEGCDKFFVEIGPEPVNDGPVDLVNEGEGVRITCRVNLHMVSLKVDRKFFAGLVPVKNGPFIDFRLVTDWHNTPQCIAGGCFVSFSSKVQPSQGWLTKFVQSLGLLSATKIFRHILCQYIAGPFTAFSFGQNPPGSLSRSRRDRNPYSVASPIFRQIRGFVDGAFLRSEPSFQLRTSGSRGVGLEQALSPARRSPFGSCLPPTLTPLTDSLHTRELSPSIAPPNRTTTFCTEELSVCNLCKRVKVSKSEDFKAMFNLPLFASQWFCIASKKAQKTTKWLGKCLGLKVVCARRQHIRFGVKSLFCGCADDFLPRKITQCLSSAFGHFGQLIHSFLCDHIAHQRCPSPDLDAPTSHVFNQSVH